MKLIPLRQRLALGILCLGAITHSAAAHSDRHQPERKRRGLAPSGDHQCRRGGDVIVFAPGVTGTITLTSGELFFSKSLTIAGPGAANLTVSGNNTSRVFSVSSGEITISGLRIANGFTSGNPNALQWPAAEF